MLWYIRMDFVAADFLVVDNVGLDTNVPSLYIERVLLSAG